MSDEYRSAAELVLHSRLQAHLTQVQLAERAGMTQSVISAYESGRREPSLPMLRALVDASGYDLVVEFTPHPVHLRRLTGPLGRRVRRNRAALKAAATEVGVSNLRVFGSVARGEERPDSDVDLLVDLPDPFSLTTLIQLGEDLGQIVGAEVDIGSAASLKPYVRDRVLTEVIAL